MKFLIVLRRRVPGSGGQTDLLKSIPAALSHTLGTQPPVGSDSRRLADDVGRLAEEPIARSVDFLHGVPVQAGTNPVDPFDPQVVQARAEILQRVVNIEDVLRLVISTSPSVDQQLLSQESHRVRDTERLRRGQSEIVRAQFNGPGIFQEQFDEP